MKKMMLVLAFFSLASNAAEIRSGSYEASTDSLVLDVVYGGGCGKHDFALEYGPCMETYPAQISVKLLHESDDPCEALISKRIKLSLEGLGSCRPAYMTVSGDRESKVSVYVPEQ